MGNTGIWLMGPSLETHSFTLPDRIGKSKIQEVEAFAQNYDDCQKI
jgi:hypothetical protein